MDYRRLTRFAIVAAAVAIPGLGTAQEVRRRSDVITRDEIERAEVEDAFQVVLRLRPEFLHRTQHARSNWSEDGSGSGSGVLGSAVAGGKPTSAKRASDPDAPEFDEGSTGTSAGPTADGPVGFAGSNPRASTSGRGQPGVGGLRTRVVVYIGTTLTGGIEELTSLPAAAVKEIRYLRPSEAQFRFGAQHGNAAAIVVTLVE